MELRFTPTHHGMHFNLCILPTIELLEHYKTNPGIAMLSIYIRVVQVCMQKIFLFGNQMLMVYFDPFKK